MGEDAFAEGLGDALFDGADVLLRNDPTDGLVAEFEACSPRQRLYLKGNASELPVPTGLLLVRVLGLRRRLHRLAVGHLRHVHLEVDAELAPDLLERYFHVRIAEAR